jgi:hypothetical protein
MTFCSLLKELKLIKYWLFHLWRLNDYFLRSTYFMLLFDLSLPMTYALYLFYLNSYVVYICESLAKFYLPKPIHIQVLLWCNLQFANLYIDELDYDWFLWYETTKLVITLRIFFMLAIFVHALWVSTLEISQTSLGIHPKPKTSFCDYLLDHNPNWVWMIFR